MYSVVLIDIVDAIVEASRETPGRSYAVSLDRLLGVGLEGSVPGIAH